MKRVKSILVASLVGAALLTPCAGASVRSIRVDGAHLSLDVRNEPLTTILDEFTRGGIRIRIDPKIHPRITASFDDRPIGAALGSILRSYDYALIWGKEKGDGSEEPSLREIQIFEKGQEGKSLPFYSKTNLVIEQDAKGVLYVKDTLLVRFDPAMSDSERRTLLELIGATIVDESASLAIIRLHLPEGSDAPAIAKTLARVPGIQGVEPDYAHALEGDKPVSTDEFSPEALEPSASTGSTTIAVLDSGLLGDYADSRFVEGAYDAVSSSTLSGDTLGHGTQMALIASGTVVPLGAQKGKTEGSPVVAIRAFDDNGFTSNYTLIRGIDYAIDSGAKVLSMSWGSEQSSPFLQSAMKYATDQGVLVVAAAGNTPSGKPVYPAAFENVIGVGALTPDGKPWVQSNYGNFVALYAPGVADLPVGSDGEPGIYAGTSIATAYTARRIAAILDRNPKADLPAILRQLSTGK